VCYISNGVMVKYFNSNEPSRNINKVPNSQIKIGRLVQFFIKKFKTIHAKAR
jgi:hypothetical protein